MDKKSQSDSDPFDDDDLFDGLTDSDYQVDDDLSEGAHVHEDDIDAYKDDADQDVYHYEDEEGISEEKTPGTGQRHGMLDRFKQTLKTGSLSDKLRAILIPLIFAILILGFCAYKLIELMGPSSSQTAPTSQGLDVRQFIAKPQDPTGALNTNTNQADQKKPVVHNTAGQGANQNTAGQKANQNTAVKPDLSVSNPSKAVNPPTVIAKVPIASQHTANMPAQNTQGRSVAQALPTQPLNATQTATMPTPAMSVATNPAQVRVNTVQSNEQKTLQGQTLSAPQPVTNVSAAALHSAVQAADKADAAIVKMRAQQVQNTQKIVALQSQVSQMNKQFTDLNMRLKSLLGTLQAQVVGLKKAREAAQKVAVLNKKAQKSYSVQAMIPGRAWLKTSKGQALSVTQGNVVPGYGVVTDIDVDNGIVRTSSGAILTYTLGQ